ncbi:hypothetical protein B0T24DRAFT_609179 [Lasiosphaeria ovina]|uniref:Uncharacterized protein n=1 Tax=Lasiosphaeria ovina TaxID=92902 RepID=A0AAE0NN95_9PEZI|nr:hypothetical protein B0T24DRAFT_609179 [Lasiosphaeria ovina]
MDAYSTSSREAALADQSASSRSKAKHADRAATDRDSPRYSDRAGTLDVPRHGKLRQHENQRGQAKKKADEKPAVQKKGGHAAQGQQRSRSFGSLGLVLVVAAAVAALFMLPLEPPPEPDYTVVKPFNPSPVTAFMQLLERHALAPVAIIASGATDWNLYYNLRWSVAEYCMNLGMYMASDYGDSEREIRRREYEQRRRKALAEGRKPPPDDDYEWDTLTAEGKVYYGPAHDRVLELCYGFDDFIGLVPYNEVVPLHADMGLFWGNEAITGLLSAATTIGEIFAGGAGDDANAYPSVEGYVTKAEFSMGAERLHGGDRSLNSSFAIPVLQQLSRWVTWPQRYSATGIVNLMDLQKSLPRVVAMADEILGPSLEQWCADHWSFEPPGRPAPDWETWRLLKKIARNHEDARAALSRLREAGDRFAGPAAEGLSVTGPEVAHLKAWIDGLVAGRGWTRLIRYVTDDDDDGKKHWMLERYYLPLRPDLPTQLNALAESLRGPLKELVHEYREKSARDFANRKKLPMDIVEIFPFLEWAPIKSVRRYINDLWWRF